MYEYISNELKKAQRNKQSKHVLWLRNLKNEIDIICKKSNVAVTTEYEIKGITRYLTILTQSAEFLNVTNELSFIQQIADQFLPKVKTIDEHEILVRQAINIVSNGSNVSNNGKLFGNVMKHINTTIDRNEWNMRELAKMVKRELG